MIDEGELVESAESLNIKHKTVLFYTFCTTQYDFKLKEFAYQNHFIDKGIFTSYTWY